MKPVFPRPSTSKGRSNQECKFKKKFASMKKKDQQKFLKRYWKKEQPLVAQVPRIIESRPPLKRYIFHDEESSSSESDDQLEACRESDNEMEHTDEEYAECASSSNSNVAEKKILIFPAKKTGIVLLLVNHPTSFIINGTAGVQVISGTANVLGYELDASKDFSYVYSTKNICHLSMETTSCEVKTLLYWVALEKKLKLIMFASQINELRKKTTDTSVLIAFQENSRSGFVKFAHRYIPLALPLCSTPNTHQLAEMGFTITGVDESIIKLSSAHSSAAQVIALGIHSFVHDGGRTPRILIYGQKSLGKSTSLRYFINKVLSSNFGKRIFFLDVDPGQPEFTLPGCMSLTEIKGPLLGPSYTHLKTPLKCKFFGNLTLESPMKYFPFLDELLNMYLEKYSNEILFVNTFGWIKGLGRDVLKRVQAALQPTIEIELFRDNTGSSRMTQTIAVPGPSPHILRIPGYVPCQQSKILPATRRGIQIMSYFGKCLQVTNQYKTLNAIKPFKVSLQDCAIHILEGEDMDLDKTIVALCCSVVALCTVGDNEILHPLGVNDPMRLFPSSNFGDCWGFGFVRDVNIEDRLLYIITPLEYIKLRYVNALIKGKVEMPSEAFLKQAGLPAGCRVNYLQKVTSDVLLGKKVKRRTFHPKLLT